MSKQKKSGKKRSSWKGRERREGDAVMSDPRDTDIVIPIMGPTGVGKSTFINTVVGKPVAKVGHDLRSQTARLQHVIVTHPREPNRRIVFVDTPGFDDTYVEDSEILRRIAVWLATSYSDNMKLAGVIYLHEISQARMLGTTRKNLDMFNKLCGNDAIRNVILATTKWGDVSSDIGARREEQLSKTYWEHMLALGSTMCRFMLTRDSAWSLIEIILRNVAKPSKYHGVDSLQIQEELVELHKILPQTEAAQELRYTLKELLEAQKAIAQQLQEQTGAESDEQLQKRVKENENKIRSVMLQIRELKVPLSKRIASFFGLG